MDNFQEVIQDLINSYDCVYESVIENIYGSYYMDDEELDEEKRNYIQKNVTYSELEYDEETLKNEEAEEEEIDKQVYDKLIKNLYELYNMDPKTYESYIKILAIEYFMINRADVLNDTIIYKIIIGLILDQDNKKLISATLHNKDILKEMINSVIETHYYDNLDYYSYDNLSNTLETEIGQYMFNKLHPNIKKELSSYKIWEKETITKEKIISKPIKSLKDFFINMIVFSSFQNKNIVAEALFFGLNQIKIKDIELFRQIYTQIIEYVYLYTKYKCNETNNATEQEKTAYKLLNSKRIYDIVNKDEIEINIINIYSNYNMQNNMELLYNKTTRDEEILKKIRKK